MPTGSHYGGLVLRYIQRAASAANLCMYVCVSYKYRRTKDSNLVVAGYRCDLKRKQQQQHMNLPSSRVRVLYVRVVTFCIYDYKNIELVSTSLHSRPQGNCCGGRNTRRDNLRRYFEGGSRRAPPTRLLADCASTNQCGQQRNTGGVCFAYCLRVLLMWVFRCLVEHACWLIFGLYSVSQIRYYNPYECLVRTICGYTRTHAWYVRTLSEFLSVKSLQWASQSPFTLRFILRLAYHTKYW